MAVKPYFVLLVKYSNKWSIEFGDYDRQTVKDEQADFTEQTKLLTMYTDNQTVIESTVAILNGD